MLWFGRICAVMFKEFRQLSRDRLTFGMVVMLPLIQLLLFGYAINNNIRNIHIGIVDDANSFVSRGVIEAVQASQVVTPTVRYFSIQEAEQGIRVGEVRAVLYLPENLEQRIAQRHQGSNHALGQWIVDASDNIVSSALLGLRDMPLAEVIRQPVRVARP